MKFICYLPFLTTNKTNKHVVYTFQANFTAATTLPCKLPPIYLSIDHFVRIGRGNVTRGKFYCGVANLLQFS